jgi:hypothetical protein
MPMTYDAFYCRSSDSGSGLLSFRFCDAVGALLGIAL